MKSWHREPLVHFLFLGVALFGFCALVNDQPAVETDTRLVVGKSDFSWLRERWVRQWNRPPTESELQGLIEQYIREELYFRKALALGLDGADTIIRRRLVQKMQFHSKDLALQAKPTGETLLAFFEEHLGCDQRGRQPTSGSGHDHTGKGLEFADQVRALGRWNVG